MTSTQPLTSPTPLPGYNQTVTGAGTDTHADWMDAFVNYLSSRWAHGDHSIVPPAQYGIPGPNETDGRASPATILAFSQWAAHYQPGDSAQVDSILPFIPAGPNDYQESPAQTAARIAQNNWDATFGQTQSNADRSAWQQAFANDIALYGYAVQGSNNKNDFVASLFNTQQNANSAANALLGSIYNTQAGMYNTGENNRVQSLSNAGTLAGQLQNMWDQRTQNAINLQAHPNDFIERESAVRALNAPQGTDVPAYQNVDALQQVIDRLIHYQPGPQPAQPTPTPASSIPTPQYTAPPNPPHQQPLSDFTSTHTGSNQVNPPPNNNTVGPMPRTTQPTPTSGAYSGIRNEDVAGLQRGQWALRTTGSGGSSNVSDYQHPGGISYHVFKDQNTPWDANTPIGPNQAVWLQAYAHGGETGLHQFISGDPQQDGRPNPELVQISGQNVHTRVTPLRNVMMGREMRRVPGYAYGTGDTSGMSEYDRGSGFDRTTDNSPFATNTDQSAPGRMVYSTTPSTSAAPVYQQPNQPVSAPGNQVYQGTNQSLGSVLMPQYQTPPQLTLKSYPDSAYQNLPSLQYLLGNMSREQYNTLATGSAPGAFGTQAPESGSINYGRYLDIHNDPVSEALLQSIYSSANRDYLAEVSRAKARAPFGQAVNTSLVRT